MLNDGATEMMEKEMPGINTEWKVAAHKYVMHN